MDQQKLQELAAFFRAEAIGWKPQNLTKDKSKAMAVAYLDARAVMDRLDDVCGPAGWSDKYDVLPSGAVLCTLSINFDGDWVSKSDVGSVGQSEEKEKTAFTDSLKRAAVKWGIGRYLYRLPKQWVPFDGYRITEDPKIPADFLPPPELSAKTRRRLHAVGNKAYGDQWDDKRHVLVEHITGGAFTSSNNLTEDQAMKLIAGIENRGTSANTPEPESMNAWMKRVTDKYPADWVDEICADLGFAGELHPDQRKQVEDRLRASDSNQPGFGDWTEPSDVPEGSGQGV